MTTILNIATALGAIGTFIMAVIAFVNVLRHIRNARFKPETLFGDEAVKRHETIRGIIGEKQGVFEIKPYPYTGGGNKATPQLQIAQCLFDPHTMPREWKRFTKVIRYYEENGDGITVSGWRL